MLHFSAFLVLGHAYTGMRKNRKVTIAPPLEWVQDRSLETGWTLEDHLLYSLARYPEYGAANVAFMAETSDIRRRGVYLLVLCVLLYALLFGAILATGITV